MGFLYSKSHVEIYHDKKVYKSKKVEWKCPDQAETPEGARLDKELGEDDYITKPFNNKDLLAIITKKITQKRENY